MGNGITAVEGLFRTTERQKNKIKKLVHVFLLGNKYLPSFFLLFTVVLLVVVLEERGGGAAAASGGGGLSRIRLERVEEAGGPSK